MIQDNEAIYDEQINPLMGQIIALCKEHGIPFIACFQLNDGDEEDAPLLCSSANIPKGTAPQILAGYDATGPKPTWHFTTLTIKKEPS